MKIHAYIKYFILVAFLQFAFPKTITNIMQKIENGRIVITFDLQGDSGDQYNINLTATKEGDLIIPKIVAGDLAYVSPGTHKVIWWEPVLENRSLTGWLITLTADLSLFNMIYIPGGTFDMGCGSCTSDCDENEKPVHTVTVSNFYMSTTEVTVNHFRKFVEATHYTTDAERGDGCYVYEGNWNLKAGANWRTPGFSQTHDDPVVCVSWNDAVAFTVWLSNTNKKNYRLPSEAEWEYAARSGGKNEKYAGTNSNLDDYAWIDNNSGNKTHPVGQKIPNGLGLYDMSGNVWEWCSDWYDEDYYKISPVKDPEEIIVVHSACYVGALGTPRSAIVDLPIASTIIPTVSTSITVFVLPRICSYTLNFFRFNSIWFYKPLT